jgi:hypothetical protein
MMVAVYPRKRQSLQTTGVEARCCRADTTPGAPSASIRRARRARLGYRWFEGMSGAGRTSVGLEGRVSGARRLLLGQNGGSCVFISTQGVHNIMDR